MSITWRIRFCYYINLFGAFIQCYDFARFCSFMAINLYMYFMPCLRGICGRGIVSFSEHYIELKCRRIKSCQGKKWRGRLWEGHIYGQNSQYCYTSISNSCNILKVYFFSNCWKTRKFILHIRVQTLIFGAFVKPLTDNLLPW
jgi:hypothetical protein